ncbi:helix-turn-helix domain-containing protein [Candidatus Sumerlaeota bacterium]|nr:helix-turn-helix domain-containing protein [Candidatus Sumerlaeota bacterium]
MKFLTTREMAGRLQISESALLRMVRQGQVPYIRLGPRTIRFDPDAIDAWRKQFFDIGGHEDGTTQDARLQRLGVPVQDRQQDMDAFDGPNGSQRGGKGNSPAAKARSVAAFAAERVAEVVEGHRSGGRESRGRRQRARGETGSLRSQELSPVRR